MLIAAVQLEKDGFALMLAAYSIDISDTVEFDTALADEAVATLEASNAKFADFATKRDAMMKELGLLDATKATA